MNKNFKYNIFEKYYKKLYRIFNPIKKSSYTIGQIEDICEVCLVPPVDLKMFFKNCMLKLQILKGNNIGDYLEFGVFNGSSLSSAYLTAKELGMRNINFYGFDAFQGLPKEVENEDDGVWKEGFYKCSFEKMKECIERKGVNFSEITFVKGRYQDTLNEETIREYKIDKIGIVFIDCDTYSSSKTVLEFIGPLIIEPIIICFDDRKLNDLDIKGMGEYQSFNEFLERNKHLQTEEIKSYNRKSKSFIIKPENF